MATQSLIYANARVKVLENTLLSHEKITRMVYAESLQDGVRILSESGYGGVTIGDAYEYETMLASEDARVESFVRESMPKGSGMETFSVRNDYHNAKALCKAKYMREQDASYMLAPRGLIDTDALQQAIVSDEYVDLPPQMRDALQRIDRVMTEHPDPSRIDTLLDRAMYEDVTERMRKAKNPLLVRYWQAQADLSNVSIWLRSKAVDKSAREFCDDCMPGGIVGIDALAAIYDQPVETLAEKLRYTPYRALSDLAASGDMVAYEAAWDDYLLAIFKDGRNDLFSVAPLAGFYVAKKAEIRNVRMILILLKNNADKSAIKRRLRGLYE